MIIGTLRIRNFLCFRGEHILKLEPKVYAVVAHLVGDAERSNWLGKSSLLEAIYFVLTGNHRKRTEDEWITNGEGAGEVELILSDGTRLLRSRVRGKRTTLYFNGDAIQDEAQKLVDAALGLSDNDFKHTCYFEQKQMARFVTAKPEDRMGIISDWLRLGPLEECEDRAREEVAKLSLKVEGVESQRAVYNARLLPHDSDVFNDIVRLEIAVERCKAAVGRLQDEIQKNASLISAKSKVSDFDQLVSEGTSLAGQVKEKGDLEALRKMSQKLAKSEAELAAALTLAQRQRRDREQLARGVFDGRCPVMAAPCPTAKVVSDTCKKNQGLVDEAVEVEGEARVVLAVAEEKAVTARAKVQEVDRLQLRLDQMREQAGKIMDEVETARGAPEAQDPHLLRARLDEAQARFQEAVSAHSQAVRALAEHHAAEKSLATLGESNETLSAELSVWREALTIFGKQGAQKKVAEASLAAIEEGANQALEDCHVDLRVQVRWSREGSGLAKTCDTCGNPFPTSAKVKACPRCQAARGPLLVNKLDFAISDVSGAAQDLAGATVQLSAASWLRSDRGSNWAVALLDEPFGSLDKTHRKAFGAHLATMLGHYGFEQALIVAHHPDVLDALPGRIEITSENGSSSVRVVA